MEIDNKIARALLKTILEELPAALDKRLRELKVECTVEDMRIIKGKPQFWLRVRIVP